MPISKEAKRIIRDRIQELQDMKLKEQKILDEVIPDLKRYQDKKDAHSSNIENINTMLQDLRSDLDA